MSSLLLGRERRTKRSQNDSESEAGASDSNSLSGESESGVNVNFKPPRTPTIPAGTKRGGIRRNSEWEIIEGLRHGERYEEKPQVWKGFLEKKRKWPLKGWHKRYFVLDDGILKYGKSPTDVSRGKIHGWVDIGLSVISTKSKSKRIDIDAEEFIYHLKAKQYEVFEGWAEQLKKHRLYRQHLLTFGSGISASPSSVKQPLSRKLATEGSPPQRLHFIMDGPLQVAMTELNHTQQSLIELSRILEMIEHGNQDNESIADGLSPNVKKDRKRFGLRKKKSNKGSSVDLSTQNSGNDLSPQGGQANRQNEIPSLTVSSIDPNLASDFYILAKDICSSLKSVAYTLRSEKERLAETAESSSLRLQLSAALRQNTDLRTRLQSVHRSSDLSSLPEAIPINGGLKESLSRLSCSSEYQDAKESLSPAEDNRSETSSHLSQSSEDLSGSSLPESDLPDSEYNIGEAEKDRLSDSEMPGIDRESLTGRRSRLPAPQPPSPPSLWELLSKNIGKDLSQVSMPVSLNEPLNMLQRLCEELEYSELLDKAAELNDPFERMTYVAAFAVSAYGSTYFRAGSKPFNPLLGETFECIREDKGFKFIAEQVSHHPPISVCHASSKNFVFWADSRIKTKFWGRSMEFQPIGHVNVRLERPNNSGSDVYRWNKVTSCVHNLFGGQRWVDQYGDLIITSDHSVSCKLNFVKASFWSQKKHEVIGQVIDQRSGEAVRKLFGKWSEALYCGEKASSAKCIWRQGTMPPNHEMYYGFTRFAIELNELPPDMVNCLPVTDTRFRPDQRLLEEGKIDEAESAKQRLEQAQRERRKRFETDNFHYQPKWFRKVDRGGNEEWELLNYWEVRKSGFVNANLEPLW